MKLPIDVVPGAVPPTFRWTRVVETLGDRGREMIEHEGTVPAGIEDALLELIRLTKSLQAQVRDLTDRVAAQSELLSKTAEKPAQGAAPVLSSKKVRG